MDPTIGKNKMFFTQKQDTNESDFFKEKIASFDIETYKRELELGFLRLENDLLADSVMFYQRQLERKAV